jgi:1-deoxy-D-xylulose-5-phosphate reductoisomerase
MSDTPKRIAILGSTGSIGRAAAQIAATAPGRFEVTALCAGSNAGEMSRQLAAFPGARWAMRDDDAALALERLDPGSAGRSAGVGIGGIRALLADPVPDLVINALVGIAGLEPSVRALEAGCTVALANKESLVAGGDVIGRISGAAGRILPVDSEHFSLSRCLRGHEEEAERIVLTASGGALRGRAPEDFAHVSVEEVLDHPTWKMGPKVTVDSALLLNKGLEVIEAHRLFGFGYDSIDVIIHPQSLVHGIVRLRDGSMLAHIGPADMRLPLMSAMYHPDMERFPWGSLPLERLAALEFHTFDADRYPAFGLAMQAARAGGTAPAVLNAADETAVDAFLAGRIGFTTIIDWIEEALGAHTVGEAGTVEAVHDADRRTREFLARRHPEATAS